ncbi:MAG TPA: hypothetical protein VHH88_07525, partial [Verrucomicrobiae bacterium]|nr:hypothetical protein [Verrucomicrobiae bacterium]
MKIQCACGQKFAFEVTPEMARKPVHFVCPSCGLDSSASVAALVMEELGIAPPPPGASKPGTAPPAPPLRGTASASSSPASAPRQVAVMQGVPREVSAPAAVPSTLKIHRDAPAAAPAPEVAEGETGSHSAQRCAKHPGQFAVERCVVCSKPLCPQCM